ncbi:MAG TPA: hypothetical protein DDY18_04590 [Flavobacterium sp.]|jgi:hypothetical protein|nr:hypothetical protein [Flavobacterium sp.]
MKYIFLAILLALTGCGNKVEVPQKVEQCFKDPKTGDCTNQVNVTITHIITIQLPDAFTDECKRIWNETDYPDKSIRDAGYNQCIADYLDQIADIINGLNPSDIPPVAP